ncbi:MAG: hypothetical protein ABIA47_00015 [bacterium]
MRERAGAKEVSGVTRHPNIEMASDVFARLRINRRPISEEEKRIIGECICPLFCEGSAQQDDPVVRRLKMVIDRRCWQKHREKAFGKSARESLRMWVKIRMFLIVGRPEKGDTRAWAMVDASELMAMLLVRPEDVESLPRPEIGLK